VTLGRAEQLEELLLAFDWASRRLSQRPGWRLRRGDGSEVTIACAATPSEATAVFDGVVRIAGEEACRGAKLIDPGGVIWEERG
jgi:hypothetical protein